MTKLGVITGSSRPGRFNIQPATWIFNLAQQRSTIETQLIDIQELNLPFLDEPVPPLMQQYSKSHTKSWSKTVDQIDGFIWVTPEYNHSFSAVLKNAIDYLSHEWSYKPVSFVSYGSQAGGSRAAEHLRAVAGELKMFDLKEQILLSNYWGGLNQEGQFQFTPEHEKAANILLDELIFWSQQMSASRKQLASK